MPTTMSIHRGPIRFERVGRIWIAALFGVGVCGIGWHCGIWTATSG